MTQAEALSTTAVYGISDIPGRAMGTTTSFGTLDDAARGVAIQTDGKIVVVGYAYTGKTVFALARYNTNGSLDTSFNTTGKVITPIGTGNVADFAYAIAIQSDGKITVAGYATMTTQDFTVVCYNSDGSLDKSFDTDGQVTTDVNGTGDVAYGVAIQSDGSTPPDFGTPGLITNGVFAPEGTYWMDARYAVRLRPGEALTVDLGAQLTFNRVRVQADCNDTYRIEYSVDNLNWATLYNVPYASPDGLLTRDSGIFPQVTARYVRIYATAGDSAYSVSELAVYSPQPDIWASGVTGSALHLGGGDPIEVPDSNSLDLTNQGTIELWAKKDSNRNYQAYVTKGTSNAYQLLDYGTTGRLALRWGSNSDNLVTDAELSTGAWSHIAATYDGSHLRIYINGQLSKDTAYTTDAVANTDPLRIGSRIGGYGFAGTIDEVVIYNKALTPAEVSARYTRYAYDFNPPSIANLNPANGATNVTINSNLSLTLSDSGTGVNWSAFLPAARVIQSHIRAQVRKLPRRAHLQAMPLRLTLMPISAARRSSRLSSMPATSPAMR